MNSESSVDEFNAFADKWHGKIVRIKSFYDLPDKEYKVTAALLESNPLKHTIFAIIALDYNVENRHWFTFNLTAEEVKDLDNRFEILR